MVSAKKIKRVVKTGVSLLKTKRLIPIEHPIDEQNKLNGKVALITGGTGGDWSCHCKIFCREWL